MSVPAQALSARPRFGALVLWLVGLVLAGLLLIPLAHAWALAPDLGHGWAAPLLIAYLWWERWPERPGLSHGAAPSLIILICWVLAVLLAVPLRLLLTPYPLWPVAVILYVSILVAIALSFAGVLAGRAGVRWLGGPLLVLFAVLPWPGGVERALILPVREGIASLVAEISNLAGQPALAAGTSVRLAGGWVGIDEACGGIRSLQAAVMTALFFGEWLRLSWRRRLALVVAGAVAAVVGNFGRVLILTWCAGRGVLDSWHDPAGWMALGFSLVATGALGWAWRQPDAAGQATARRQSIPAAISPRLPCWSLGLVLTLGGIELGTRLWYALGASRRADVPQWTVQLPQSDPTFRREALTESAREMLRPDGFLSASWLGSDQIQRNANYIVWEKGQAARSAPFLHNPTVCLPYAGCELVESLGVIDVPWTRGVIPFHAFVFRRMNEDLIVAFAVWDPTQGRPLEEIGEGWRGWWRRQWRDVAEARQNQPAQLLSFAMVGRENEVHLRAELARLIFEKR